MEQARELASLGVQESKARGGSGWKGEHDGTSVRFARLMDLCHLQHAELAKHLKMHSGRVVLRSGTALSTTVDTEPYSPNKRHQLPRWQQQDIWIHSPDIRVWQEKQKRPDC